MNLRVAAALAQLATCGWAGWGVEGGGRGENMAGRICKAELVHKSHDIKKLMT